MILSCLSPPLSPGKNVMQLRDFEANSNRNKKNQNQKDMWENEARKCRSGNGRIYTGTHTHSNATMKITSNKMKYLKYMTRNRSCIDEICINGRENKIIKRKFGIRVDKRL